MVTVVTMAVIGVMSVLALFALWGRARARAVITRIENRLRTKVESQGKIIVQQNKELTTQAKEIVELGKYVHRIEGRLARTTVAKLLPSPPENTKRSVLFLHNSYYHFLYLAAALRRRGWDAVLVSNFPPNYYARSLFHGEDANLFSKDPYEFRTRLHGLLNLVPERFRMVHFAGQGLRNMSFFRDSVATTVASNSEAPWDFREIKERGVKIGYTISGCLDGVRQSVFKHHNGACAKCAWELRPDVCSDTRNAAWGEMLVAMCDLVAVEADYGHEWRGQSFVYREPLTTALDPNHWKFDLDIPEKWRLMRTNGELLVLHGFANAAARRFGGRDIKGTGAIIAAVERLQREGFKVRLIHPTDVPSTDMRFIQAQADIIIDQLVIGRYGAQAREGMMLAKPTICHIDPHEPQGISELTSLQECPLVEATELTIYPVLKRLLSSPEERERIGRASRAYAMKWHAADNAAERYERIYDRVMAGMPLNVSESEINGLRITARTHP